MGGSGGHRRLPGGSDHFSWQTDMHHNIYIIILTSLLNGMLTHRSCSWSSSQSSSSTTSSSSSTSSSSTTKVLGWCPRGCLYAQFLKKFDFHTNNIIATIVNTMMIIVNSTKHADFIQHLHDYHDDGVVDQGGPDDDEERLPHPLSVQHSPGRPLWLWETGSYDDDDDDGHDDHDELMGMRRRRMQLWKPIVRFGFCSTLYPSTPAKKTTSFRFLQQR